MSRTERPLTISNAMVCVDCEHIFSAYDRKGDNTCPKCASRQIALLAGWIAPGARSFKGREAA